MLKIFGLLIAMLAAPPARDDVTVTGPDGRIAFRLIFAGELAYGITLNGHAVVEPSRLGILLDGVDLGAGANLGTVERYEADETFPWRGVHSPGVNRFRGARIALHHRTSATPFVVDVRVFDDGVAFRYVVPGDGDRVPDEATSFKLPPGSRVWYHDFQGHYEGSHTERAIEDMPLGDWAAPPLTFRLPDARGYASITEAALLRFAGLGLQASEERVFAARLGHAHPPSYPFTLRYGEEEAARLSQAAVVRGPITYPWRVVLIGEDLNALVNSDVIPAVSPPPDPELFPDGLVADWLRPVRCVWQYLDGGDRSIAGVMEFSRLASDLGFECQVVEGFWRDWSTEELRDVVDYSRQRGVGIWLWKHSRDLRTQEERDAFFRLLEEVGAAGAKIDFFDHEAKEVVELYETMLRDAAAHRIVVNFHGTNKPTGESRTYPNELNREGISGMERRSMQAWGRHNATLPFTRMLAGHADFTPMLFGERRRETSWAHQIATAAVLSAPALVYGAHPQSILDHPAVEIIRHIPSVWDETIVMPPSEVGRIAVYARRSGRDWFVAVLNGDDGRHIDIPLEFLADGDYVALAASDVAEEAAAVHMDESDVNRDDVLSINLRPGGGYVALISRRTHD